MNSNPTDLMGYYSLAKKKFKSAEAVGASTVHLILQSLATRAGCPNRWRCSQKLAHREEKKNGRLEFQFSFIFSMITKVIFSLSLSLSLSLFVIISQVQGGTSYLFIIVITRSNMHIWFLIILFSVRRPKVQSQHTLSYHIICHWPFQ